MESVLIHLRPWDSATGARVDVYIADAAVAEAYGLLGTSWEPAVRERPELSIQLFDPDMTGRVQAGKARLELALSQITAVPNPHLLYWTGAQISIYTAEDLGGPVTEFVGRVSSADPDKQAMTLGIEGEVDTKAIDKPLLRLEFDGGGGLGGDGGKRGVLKPAGFGEMFNIEPVWFDLTDNIGMVDGYGNCLSITWLGEGLSPTGFQFVQDYETYADLKAAIIAGDVGKGQWASSVADGCVGLGAPPEGRITVHATFGAGTCGAWMRRLLLTHAQVDNGKVFDASFDALDAAVPYPIGAWFGEQRQLPDLLAAIARSCNATPLVDFQGRILVTRAVRSAPVAILDYSGSTEPRVTKVKSLESPEPYYRLRARTARPAAVFQFSEVNYTDTIDDTNGLWKVDEVYRGGDVVWRPDGSSFLYINDEPAAGVAPPAATTPPAAPAANAHWQQLLPPTSYADGTPIDALKPAQVGANVTQTNTAAAISGQGTLATMNKVSLGSSGQVYRQDTTTPLTDAIAVTSLGTAAAIAGQGALATTSQVNLGTSGQVYRDDGFTKVTDVLAITSLGTAAAIAGQGALATAGQVNFGSSGRVYRDNGVTRVTDDLAITILGTAAAISGQGSLATRSTALLGTHLYRADGATVLTDATAVTSLGTAAAIAGQGAFATVSSAAYGSALLTGFGTLAPRNNVRLANEVYRADGATVLTDALAVTSLGTAAAIAGQGALATLGQVNFGSSGRVYRDDGVTRVTDTLAVTSLGTAAAISGQGAFATVSTAAYGSALLTGFGTLAPRNNVRLANEVYRADGATVLTDALAVTSLGTASAIAGQGALATLGQVNFGSSGRVYRDDGSTRVTDAGAITALGTAAAISGQGTLATRNTALLGTHLYRQDAVTVVTDSTAITSLGTAAALAGQGALATLNVVDFVTRVVGVGKPAAGAGTTINFTAITPAEWLIEGNAVTKTVYGWGNAVAAQVLKPPSYISFRVPASTWAGVGFAAAKPTTNGETGGRLFYAQGGAMGILSDVGYTASVGAQEQYTWTIIDDGRLVHYMRDDVRVAYHASTGSTNWPIVRGLIGGVTDIQFGPAHLQPDIGVNLIDSASGSYTAVVARSGILTSLGTAAAIAGQGSMATENYARLGLTLRDYANNYVLGDAPVITAQGTAAAIAGQGALATKSTASMDSDVTDGATYVRPKALYFTAGQPKVQIAGSGQTIGGPRNLPPIAAINLGYKFTGAITYSANSSGSATISVGAGQALIGSSPPSYNAMSVGVSGTPGTTVAYQLYVDENADTSTWGGSKTLNATTSGNTVYGADTRMWVGAVSVFYPTTGGSSGGGSGGGGAGGGGPIP